MIVPMTKYRFLVFHRDVNLFLDRLMEAGVVHLELPPVPAAGEAAVLSEQIREAEALLRRFSKRREGGEPPAAAEDEAFPMLTAAAGLESELEGLRQQKAHYARQVKLLEPWGEIPANLLERLEAERGVRCHFYQYPKARFRPEWQQNLALEMIGERDGICYFVVFAGSGGNLPPLEPLPLPRESLASSRALLRECEEREAEISAILDDMATRYMEHFRRQVDAARDQLDRKQALAGMESPQGMPVGMATGWCPAGQEAELEERLGKLGVVCLKDPEADRHLAPVLLKNNAFSRLFEPIGRMFSLPSPAEIDLTPYFAPFFLLFFGFCLGDAGYGLVLLLVATVARYRVKPDYKPYAKLLQWFGLSTLVIGFFSGTLFGIGMLDSPAFSGLHPWLLNQDQLFRAALVIGFAQIVFGLGVNVYRSVALRGWVHGASKLGWIVLMLSLADMLVVRGLPGVTGVTVWIGAGLIVAFGNPEKGAVRSVGAGLADLYNITGVLGDLLSYIRLFALGVSSAILGLVVNHIALSAKGIPYVGFVLFLLILVAGHTGNLLLASLSAFVHPMRLTFVEFYKNSGFTGGGKPYRPFQKRL